MKNNMNNLIYQEIHRWLRKNYGNANKCESAFCGDACKIYEWALLKHKKYDKNRENFVQLCKRCHCNYDNKFTFKEGHKLFIGVRKSPQHRHKLSISKMGNKNPMFGKIGKLNPFYGKKHSVETINKIKESIKLRKLLNEETDKK